jgi:hypothetical protein
MRPVVAHLRAMGHRVYSYLDDIFGAAATAHAGVPATEADTKMAGRDISTLFRRLGLWLHPTKCDFVGMFLLSPAKLR